MAANFIYDEFGNLIGGEDSDSDNLSDISGDEEEVKDDDDEEEEPNESQQAQLVSYKNNANGLTLSQRFGPEVTTVVAHTEDSMSEPVIRPARERTGKIEVTISDDTDPYTDSSHRVRYSLDYMVNLMYQLPERIRNIALVGNLHSGKTSFVDMLVLQTHETLTRKQSKNFEQLKFTDNHILEIKRGMSIKAAPITLLLPDTNGKSYIFNILDSPGHMNFMDETIASLEASDGAVIVLDVVEGLTFADKFVIDEIMKRNLKFSLVLNKIDRLILELRLPVSDAYYKLQYIIDNINNYISNSEYSASYAYDPILSPERNNVTFASSTLQFCFNLNSFVQLYFDAKDITTIDKEVFARRLWGNNYYNPESHKFTKDSKGGSLSRTFIHFILEPIYKIITYTITRDSNSELLPTLLKDNFGISFTAKQLKNNSQMLLPEIFLAIFPSGNGFVNMVTNSIYSPAEAIKPVSVVFQEPVSQDKVIAHIVKLIESSDGESFSALVRIHQGTLKVGDQVNVISDTFKTETEVHLQTVSEIHIPGGRYKVPVNEASEGFLVIVKGIETSINKHGYIFDKSIGVSDIKDTKFIDYTSESVLKVAVEPKNPSELPRLVESLKKLNKGYLSSVVKLEESGEYVVFGTGEVILDCMLHDIRNFYEDGLEIRVSDPMVKFSETVTEMSVTKISSTIGDISMSIIAEPINNEALSKALEAGKIDLNQPIKTVSRQLRNDFGVDSLEARSVWSYGPHDHKQPSILVDDTLEAETDKKALYTIKQAIEMGFQWSCSEGPLCDEPIRNTKFKILDIDFNDTADIQTNTAQIIPLTRRACYTGFLTASPRLMEPVYKVLVTCSSRANHLIAKLLNGRRGKIHTNDAIPGTQLFQLEGIVPVIESIGFETELRLQTQGQAMCLMKFDGYSMAPGNPLDDEVYLPELKPVPMESIARDFVLKTRRRKGLTGEASLHKYIDPELYEKLKSIGLK
ncbi:P-loop containing nucleoside triphosphate hydrolase protein [Yamadazyma tenuis ATCC 10573]|uniref:p-loop containing nucleoside triphosphate hydrolase protein n=1 Tax=Candida tenuis (strain ATCC 10573 / BCRC 21748 / CBS 615 / JCM 9827 / NBRC 10315 / NRRL Y-1498 / VKM Y-70) TaxID=590646 RepID=G3BAU5_CANTC|nr:P-loop containing nucleoside triphosphate hydrolase protein [Yamadazyma tenuis ATCC 10573]EGV62113.1 P-loop containing nucleoside triphosphate hydrolase protein [Yamadazyma tenuis ATCC 10573]